MSRKSNSAPQQRGYESSHLSDEEDSLVDSSPGVDFSVRSRDDSEEVTIMPMRHQWIDVEQRSRSKSEVTAPLASDSDESSFSSDSDLSEDEENLDDDSSGEEEIPPAPTPQSKKPGQKA